MTGTVNRKNLPHPPPPPKKKKIKNLNFKFCNNMSNFDNIFFASNIMSIKESE